MSTTHTRIASRHFTRQYTRATENLQARKRQQACANRKLSGLAPKWQERYASQPMINASTQMGNREHESDSESQSSYTIARAMTVNCENACDETLSYE